MDKKCLKCGEIIHPQRLKALPNTNVCVKCSSGGKYMGTSVQFGDKDNTYEELLIKGNKTQKWA